MKALYGKRIDLVAMTTHDTNCQPTRTMLWPSITMLEMLKYPDCVFGKYISSPNGVHGSIPRTSFETTVGII